MSKACMMPSRLATTKPRIIQKLHEKLGEVEHSVDEEARIGANLPFSTRSPRILALTMILFIGIAFNIPFFITYYQMKSAKGG